MASSRVTCTTLPRQVKKEYGHFGRRLRPCRIARCPVAPHPLPLLCFLRDNSSTCLVLIVALRVAAHFTSVKSRDRGNPYFLRINPPPGYSPPRGLICCHVIRALLLGRALR